MGISAYSTVFDFTTGTQTGVNLADGIPQEFSLEQNYPNPFNPLTTIRVAVPTRSYARLQIFNVLGQEVARLVDGELDSKFYEFRWNGLGMSSGLYFYRFEALSTIETGRSFVQIRKMMLIK